MVEAVHAAIHTKECYLSAHYHRLVVRRGGKKATIAVGHKLLVIDYHILADEKDYEELGGNYFDEWDRQAVRKRLGLGSRPVVVCVSRMVPRKGQDTLIRAWPLVLATTPDATLLLVGDGPYRNRLERMARQGVANR